MKIFILNILDFIFARKFFLPINIIFLKLFIRFIGYNHNISINKNGESKFLKKICNENPELCIDIGANIGNYSKFILNNSNSRVIAFEPIPTSYKKLTILKKKYPKRFFNYKFAIGEKNQNGKIYFDKKNLHWSTLSENVRKINYLKNLNNSINCKVKTLDSFLTTIKNIKIKRLDLIKIDTEGNELEVLLGAKKTIKRYKPKYIQLEYNWHHLFKNVSLYHLSKLLNGYSVYKIFPYGQNLVKIDPQKPENNYFNYLNIVFIKKR